MIKLMIVIVYTIARYVFFVIYFQIAKYFLVGIINHTELIKVLFGRKNTIVSGLRDKEILTMSNEENQVGPEPEEIKKDEDWQPEEQKEWPEYIRSRFRLVNEIKNINLPVLKEWLESTTEKRIIPDVLCYLLIRAREKWAADQISERDLDEIFRLIDAAEIEEAQSYHASHSLESFVSILISFGERSFSLIVRWLEENRGIKTDLRINAVRALDKMGEKGRQIAQQLIDDPAEDQIIRRTAVSTLGGFGREAADYIASMVEDPDPNIQYNALAALAMTDPGRALPMIERDLVSPDGNLRRRAAYAASRMGGEKGLQIVLDLTRDPEFSVAANVANFLKNFGETAIPEIIKILQDQDRKNIHFAILNAVEDMGKPGEKLLEEIKNGQIEISESAEENLEIWESSVPPFHSNLSESERRSLIIRQEPGLTADPAVQREREKVLQYLDEVVKELRREHSEIIGLAVLGSMAKGYWTPGSDLDWGLILYRDGGVPIPDGMVDQITQELKMRLNSDQRIELCHIDNTVDLSALSQGEIEANNEIIFNSLFLGDRSRLDQLRHKVVAVADEKDWDNIRDEWDRSLDYGKMISRFGLKREQIEEIVCLRKILWSLPELTSAKKIY